MEGLPYDVVLWDWNGTLLDDGEYGISIINSMLERRGMRVPSREEHGRLFDFPVSLYYERLGFDYAKEPFEDVSHQFVAEYLAGVTRCALRPGVAAVLGALRAAGYRQLVLSASRQDLLERYITHYGLRHYFEDLLGIDSVHAPGKAGRGCEWIRGAGVDPARVLLIGDTVHDAEVAGHMGIACWLLEGGHHPRARLLPTGCPCLPCLDEVKARLVQGVGPTTIN